MLDDFSLKIKPYLLIHLEKTLIFYIRHLNLLNTIDTIFKQINSRKLSCIYFLSAKFFKNYL